MVSVQLLLAADPVHDLQLGVALADRLDEAHEVGRLVVEPEHVQAPEREGRVADPGVAVVPVALAAGRLRQRRRQRGDHAAGRRVDQPLQGQRRALQLRAPGVVGEAAALEPVRASSGWSPRAASAWSMSLGRSGGRRTRRARSSSPRRRRRRRVPVRSGRRRSSSSRLAIRLRSVSPQSTSARRAVLVELPARPRRARSRAGRRSAGGPRSRRSRSGASGAACGRRAAAGAGVALDVLHRRDQRVADDDPAGLGRPGRLDHVRARAGSGGRAGTRSSGARRKLPGAAVEDRAEDAGRVEAGQAEPLDRAVGREQGAGLAVGEEAVGADRRELRWRPPVPSASFIGRDSRSRG